MILWRHTIKTEQQENNMSDITQPYAELYVKRLLAYVNEADAEKIQHHATETSPGVFVQHREVGEVAITMIVDFHEETVTARAESGGNISSITHLFSDYNPPSDNNPEYELFA